MYLLQLIVAVLFGAVVGNFATTVYHRLPANKPINGFNKFGLKPHCSKCRHKLKFYEYLPILSWIFAPLRCNYCKKSKDLSYTFIELFGIVSAAYFFSQIGLRLEFVVLEILCVNLLLTALFALKFKKLYLKNISLVLILMLGIFLTS